MKLNDSPQFPDSVEPRLKVMLYQYLRHIAIKVNQLGSGSYAGTDNQATAAPTTGKWSQGDFVRNSNPSELGGAGSKYVTEGWLCTVAGEPGTWVEKRFLTGN